MAIKRALALLALLGLLTGCAANTPLKLAADLAEAQTSPEETQSGSAEMRAGSAATAQEETQEEAAVPAADESQEDTQSDPPVDETAEDHPLEGIVICLDAGHGVTSQSAQERVSPLSQEEKAAYVSGASGASQTEEELNLAVAELTRSALEKLGATVVMTRTAHEVTLSNIERAEIANAAEADLCIRIHADGSDDSSVSGMSMQVPSGELLGTPEIEQPSAQAAQIILDCVTETTGAKNRGLTQRSDLTGFNWSEVPCILLEMGFLSNAAEDALLAQAEYRQLIADGIAQGVCRWIETDT